MNVKDILYSDEQVLFKAQQRRLISGKDMTPGEIFVTTKRIIIETNTWLGLKKEYEDLHYSDIDGVILKKNLLSANIIIRSRFQGEIHLSGVGKKEAQQMERLISQNIDRYRYGYGGGDRGCGKGQGQGAEQGR